MHQNPTCLLEHETTRQPRNLTWGTQKEPSNFLEEKGQLNQIQLATRAVATRSILLEEKEHDKGVRWA